MNDQQRPLRILVAEDHPLNQRMMQLLLSRFGHQVDIASDGIEALHRLETGAYDVVLMDLHMPRMGGIEAAEEVQRRWPVGAPPIMAVTVDTTESARSACKAAGMVGYITKPVNREILEAELLNIPCHGSAAA